MGIKPDAEPHIYQFFFLWIISKRLIFVAVDYTWYTIYVNNYTNAELTLFYLLVGRDT